MGLIGCAAGSATGSALNGGSGWDVLKGGLMGAGMAMASYSLGFGLRESGLDGKSTSVSFDNSSKDVPKTPDGSITENDPGVKEVFDDFKEFHKDANWNLDANGNAVEGESAAVYSKRTAVGRFLTGKYYARTFAHHFQKGELYAETGEMYASKHSYDGSENILIHSHPNNSYPSSQDYDAVYRAYDKSWNSRWNNMYGLRNHRIMDSYLLAPNNQTIYKINPLTRTFTQVNY